MIFFRKSKKTPEELATWIVKHVAESSFKVFRSIEFRRFFDFANLEQTEQDRIFNELEITGVGLAVLHLDKAISKSALTEKQLYFSDLQKRVIEGLPKLLKEFGVESKYLKLWKKLIEIRLKEYREHYQIAIGESVNWEHLKGYGKDVREIWARYETMTIDSLHHIRRGKTNPKDPLRKFLSKWLIKLEKEIALKLYV